MILSILDWPHHKENIYDYLVTFKIILFIIPQRKLAELVNTKLAKQYVYVHYYHLFRFNFWNQNEKKIWIMRTLERVEKDTYQIEQRR